MFREEKKDPEGRREREQEQPCVRGGAVIEKEKAWSAPSGLPDSLINAFDLGASFTFFLLLSGDVKRPS